MQGIANRAKKESILWFENGYYRGNTERGFESINIYDQETQPILVFKESRREFVTTCQLDRDKHNEEISVVEQAGLVDKLKTFLP
jgi:hypothetical protein